MSELEYTPRPTGFYPAPPLPKPVKPIPKWVLLAAVPLVIAGIIAASLGGVALYRRGSKSALEAVAPLHAQMAAGDDAGIFAASYPAYQEQVGREKSNQLFDFVRDRLGAPKSSQVVGFNVSTESKTGEVLALTFTTEFTKGTATESIKWHKVDGRYRMLSYHVDSPKLTESDIPQNLRSWLVAGFVSEPLHCKRCLQF